MAYPVLFMYSTILSRYMPILMLFGWRFDSCQKNIFFFLVFFLLFIYVSLNLNFRFFFWIKSRSHNNKQNALIYILGIRAIEKLKCIFSVNVFEHVLFMPFILWLRAFFSRIIIKKEIFFCYYLFVIVTF